MNRTVLFKTALLLAVTTTLRLGNLSASAQMSGAGSPAGVNAALTELFGNITAFSAKADVRVMDKTQTETMTMPMNFAFLNKKLRVEVDMTQMKGKAIPPGAAENMKQMGMDRIVSVIRPDKKVMYITFPGMQSYVTTALKGCTNIVRTALGKETIDGHPCVKNKMVVTDDTGKKDEAIVWNATDLKDFPVQIQTAEKDNTVVMHYREVQFAKPDAKQFDPPGGFTEYGDMPQLVQGVMQKMMGGQKPK
jgi:hypothetical protein